MNDSTAQTLTKNIWELERRIKDGHGDPRTRLALIRAYAQQTAHTEDLLGIPPDQRSYLEVNERTRDGVLLLHGSTGSPEQLRSLGEHLRSNGFSVYGMRLRGHPAGANELENIPWQACLSDAENRYQVLSTWCQRLYIVGFSFGATLALHLNLRPRPRALILLAPALEPKLNPFVRLLLKLGVPKLGFVRRRMGWNSELLDAMDSARKLNWWAGTPILAAMAADDDRVDLRSLEHIKRHATHRGTHTKVLTDGGHVFMDGPVRDELHKHVLEFLKQN